MADHNWITNNNQDSPRKGQRYYIGDKKTDSNGNPGTWHIYENSPAQFIAANQTGGTPYTPPTPAAATPAPAASNGGTAAPNEPPVGATPNVSGIPAPPKDTSIPHPHTGVDNMASTNAQFHDPAYVRSWWSGGHSGLPPLTNTIQGSAHNGDQYVAVDWVGKGGNIGVLHLYKDGSTEFVDKAQGTFDKPYYQTNMNQGDPRYGQVYFTSITENSNGNMVELHHYGDETVVVPLGSDSNSSRSATKSSTDSPTDSSASATASGTTASTTTTSSNRTLEGQSKTSGTQHTVVAGDTLSGIAAANGIPLADLEALNPQIDNPNLIHPGEQINLGDSRDAPASAENSDTVLPTTSTYASSDATNQHQLDDGAVEKISGWVGAASEVADDPVKVIIDTVANHIQTDPTKIDDNKHNN